MASKLIWRRICADAAGMPDHADLMKKAVLFYVASELFNKRSFPKPALPDFMAV